MFVFMVAGFMAGWGTEERRNGLLRRLRSTPINTAGLLSGKLLYGLVVGLVQVLILFAVGSLAFGLRPGE